MEPATRFERVTGCLQNSCSTTELSWLPRGDKICPPQDERQAEYPTNSIRNLRFESNATDQVSKTSVVGASSSQFLGGLEPMFEIDLMEICFPLVLGPLTVSNLGSQVC